MRDNDDLHDIPPMIPSRDDVVSRQRTRVQPDIVPSVRHAEAIRVTSTWPMRVAVIFLALAMIGAAYGAYLAQQRYTADMEQAERRIADLENRLALVGNSAEETTANVLERIDFNFSEIDKLWAARRATNQSVEELTGRLVVMDDAVKQARDDIDMTGQLIAQSTSALDQARSQVAELDSTVSQLSNSLAENGQTIATLSSAVQNLQSVTQEMVNLRATMISAQGESGGLNDRLSRVEEAIEAIDAYRLQINQTVLRLQQNIESMQNPGTPGG